MSPSTQLHLAVNVGLTYKEPLDKKAFGDLLMLCVHILNGAEIRQIQSSLRLSWFLLLVSGGVTYSAQTKPTLSYILTISQ